MSRGHGKWERMILAAVGASPEGLPLDFLRLNSRSGKEAFARAVRGLTDKNEIEIGCGHQGAAVILKFGAGLTAGLKPERRVVRYGHGYGVVEFYTLNARPLSRAELDRYLAELEQAYGSAPTRVVESLDDIRWGDDVDEQLAPEVSDDPGDEIRQQVKDLAQESQQPASTRPKKGEWPGSRVEDAELWEQIGGHGFKTKEYEIDWIEEVNARASPRMGAKKYAKYAKKIKKELDKADLANEKAKVEDDATNDGDPKHEDDPARLDLQVEQPRDSDEAPEHASHDEGSPLESADEQLTGRDDLADFSPWSKRQRGTTPAPRRLGRARAECSKSKGYGMNWRAWRRLGAENRR